MYLLPSKIHFINCLGEDTAMKLADDKDITKMMNKYVERGKIPKLQVTQKNGIFFTLNNTQLQICRKLQEQGRCTVIKVEKVSHKRVPDGILKLMTITSEGEDTSASSSDGSGALSDRLSHINSADDKQYSTDSEVQPGMRENDSLSSYSLESDPESVDSEQGFDYNFDSYESSTDASTESEVQEEEESLI